MTYNKSTNLNVKTSINFGYYIRDVGEPGESLNATEQLAQGCIKNRDAVSWNCGWAGWPQDDRDNMCFGNNNGKELDRCMATIYDPEEQKTERPRGGMPYISTKGDQCFDEYYNRWKYQGVTKADSMTEWNKCMKTFD